MTMVMRKTTASSKKHVVAWQEHWDICTQPVSSKGVMATGAKKEPWLAAALAARAAAMATTSNQLKQEATNKKQQSTGSHVG